jgi:hypothetical protein
MRGVITGSMIQPDIPPLHSTRAFARRHPALIALIALFLVTFAAVRVVAALPEELTQPIRVGRFEPWHAVYVDLENQLRAKGVQFVLLPRTGVFDDGLLQGQVDVILPYGDGYVRYDAENPSSIDAALRLVALINDYDVDLGQKIIAAQGSIPNTWRPAKVRADPLWGRSFNMHLFYAAVIPALLLAAIFLGSVTAAPRVVGRIRRGVLFALGVLAELLVVTFGLEIAGRDGSVYPINSGYILFPPFLVVPMLFVGVVALPAAISFAVALQGRRRGPRVAVAVVAGATAFAIFASALDPAPLNWLIARAPQVVTVPLLLACAAASVASWRIDRGRAAP